MRVIAGDLKGRRLQAPAGQETRPTTDRVKESLFNILGPFFDGGDVLDLFAGSGALGIEALSRGMRFAHFVDRDGHAIQTVVRNVRDLGISDRCRMMKDGAVRAIRRLEKEQVRFRLVFLDPPYRSTSIPMIIKQLQESRLLEATAVIVAEHSRRSPLPERIDSYIRTRELPYGDTQVTLYEAGGHPHDDRNLSGQF